VGTYSVKKSAYFLSLYDSLLKFLTCAWLILCTQVHRGFMKNGGAYMKSVDVRYIKKCKFVVASVIFDGYDIPHQPSNISLHSQKLFCFLMMVDEVSLDFIEMNTTIKVDSAEGQWVGI
jgi:hypothetical protein